MNNNSDEVKEIILKNNNEVNNESDKESNNESNKASNNESDKESNNESDKESEVKIIKLNESDNESNNESDKESEVKIIKLNESNDESNNESEVNKPEDESNNSQFKVIKPSEDKEKSNSNSESIDLNESNIESIIFNNSNNNMNNKNFAKFISDNQIITIEEEVAIDNMNLIYKDDIVYLKELENQLLSEFPVNKQSIKFIQKNISDVAKKLIEAKNIGVKKNNMLENGIQYESILNILENKFESQYIIPVVLDKHRIYTKLKENKDNLLDKTINSGLNDVATNLQFSLETLEDPEYILDDNQLNQLITLKSIFHEKALNNISYKEYLNNENSIVFPYVPDMSSIGALRHFKNSALVLRYSDIDTVHWATYNIDNDIFYPVDIFNEDTGDIMGVNEEILLRGVDLNIIGFILLNHKDYPTKELHKEYFKIGDIKKIFNLDDLNKTNRVIIECENHGLDNSDLIKIEDSDSFPNFNNYNNISIKIIDSNTIQLINNNIKFIKNGTKGSLYKLNRLKYDEYKISKVDGILDYKFNKSKYLLNENSVSQDINSKNKLYLFNETTLSNEDYNNVIKTIMLSRIDILKLEMDNLKNAYMFKDVDEILKKYDITINNFNYDEVSLIKHIFEENLLKVVNSDNNYKNIHLNLTKNIKNKSNNTDFFLSDSFITNPAIEKIYGKYNHIGYAEDSFILRLKWIESQIDNGKIYYLYYLLHVYNQNRNLVNTFIKNKLTELEKTYKAIEKNYLKEKSLVNSNKSTHKFYKYQAYIITEDDIANSFALVKKILNNGSVVFYKDNLYLWQGKMVDFKDAPENTLAVVGDKLWVWQKGKWIESIAKPHYENIKYLCEFNNIELQNIKLDSLDCIYRKDYGCNSKVFIRLEENYNKIKLDLDNFTKLHSQFIENNKIIENINYEIKDLTEKYYSGIKYNNKIVINKKDDDSIVSSKKRKKIEDNTNKSNVDSKVEIKIDELSVLLKVIKNMKNLDMRLNYIYQIIEKDGIIIDNKIYSKKYKRPIDLCGHYYYFKKLNDIDSIEGKNKLIETMLNYFSDDGDIEKNIHTCKICGEYLLNNEYDETEGFALSGAIKMSRETWIIEKTYDKTIIEKNFDLKDFIKNPKFNEDLLKDILLKYGLSYEDIDLAVFISIFIIKNLFIKAGVIIDNDDMITIIIDCMQKIKTIKTYNIYKLTEIKKLQEKGFSKMDIEKIDKRGTFIEGYKRYSKIRKYSIIVSRYLLSIQYSIPELPRSSKTSICAFTSFYGDDGINYMTCILDEMKIVLLKDQSKTFEILKAGLLESYNDFKTNKNIKLLLKEKSIYQSNILTKNKIKKDLFKDANLINSGLSYIKNGEELNYLDKNYSKKLEKETDIIRIKESKELLWKRLHFLAYKIKNTTKSVISTSELSDIYSTGIEASCCSEEATTFINYYYGIEINSNYPVKKDIDESHELYNYMDYFIDIGSFHKYLLYDPLHNDAIQNAAIVDNENTSSDFLIKSVFEIYVDTGPYSGTLREYIGTIDNLIDLRTGISKKDIIKKDYTIEDYNKLLREIEKRNTKIPNFNKVDFYQKSDLDDLKKTSYNKLSNEINTLIKNMAIILNKDKIFIDKYSELLHSFGVFDSGNNKNNLMNISQTIKYQNSINHKKANYIKKFYNTKLRKYLSIIKNNTSSNIDKFSNINLSFVDDEDIEKDIQVLIIDGQRKLIPFFNEGIKKYFTNLKLDYTTEEINELNGIDNVYDLSYEKIKKFSDFNFNDLCNVLLYILVNQLNKFILCTSADKNKVSENLNMGDIELDKNLTQTLNKNKQCRYICDFIIILFEELEYDTDLFKNCKDGAEGIKNSLMHDKIDFKVKLYTKEDSDYISSVIEQKFGKPDSESGYETDDDVKLNYNMQKEDDLDNIHESAKEHYLNKYGSEPTIDQLEKYTSNYLKELQDTKEYEDEVYDLNGQAKGADVLDQGAGYGELNEYDFEDGDGFDYSNEYTE